MKPTTPMELAYRLGKLREMSARMAEDDGLWFKAETAAEAYVQQELRKLCALIEAPAADVERAEQDNAASSARCTPSQATQKGDGWRDIASAPKDRDILVCWASAGLQSVVRWEAGEWTEGPDTPVSGMTHWQPLPTPPSLDGEGKTK